MAINSINSVTPAGAGQAVSRSNLKGSGDSFGSLIKDAVESIDSTQKSAEKEISKAVTGETTDLHRTIIALQTADLKFQLGLQVRNKLIGAFDEIMRMPV
jgi:flagellar hook-basal body complex protein FliE